MGNRKKKKKAINWSELIAAGLIDLLVGSLLYILSKLW